MLARLFREDVCEGCGDCLAGCPVLGIDRLHAGGLVRKLCAGERVPCVLDRCTGCMSCESLCEKGAHPYGLLLEHYARRYEENGIPAVFTGAMPGAGGPDLWSSVARWLSGREREDLEAWSRPPAGEEVVFLGCNQRLTPFVARTRLFDGIEVFTDPSVCCGEFYVRLGMLDAARRRALSLAGTFRRHGIRRIVAFCPACENTIRNLWPKALGVGPAVEVTGLVPWLLGRVESGEIPVVRPLGIAATVQDPCHASMLGEQTAAEVRELLGLIGVEVVEMENSGVLAECCGLGASLARYKLRDVVRTGLKRSRRARSTGAHRACAWCNGCYVVTSMFRLLNPVAPPTYHLLELVRQAAGEVVPREIGARSLTLLLSAFEATVRGGPGVGRVHV